MQKVLRFFLVSNILKIEGLCTDIVILGRRKRGVNMEKVNMSELTAELTEEELAELEAAAKQQTVYDEDSPQMTPEMLMQFQCMNKQERVKQTISLRLSPGTLN